MNRREILRYTALATGAAVAGPLVSSLLTGCRTDTAAGAETGTLEFFKPEEFDLVRELADLILPKTDSPSASEAGVHHMIDHMVGSVYVEADQAAYRSGFTALAGYLDQSGFRDLPADKKTELLKTLDLFNNEALSGVRQAFLDFKQQVIAYYLTSEAVGTHFLTYLPVPGSYEPCITVEQAGGKAWAL
ncbi:MAG TPA: gluconate 2-dehydrogenase subunit 3 family protein [Flavilitoribacter sp.]|nr:gluconate 2-dehydrogenase subunit 3 family protein [Flavilitoribacter sp.]HMQ90677.1 gluconate 2-dehydrogenase subunit 3 family protein [Flavilitoribacter sp.]